MHQEKGSLWARVLHHKYACQKNIFPKFKSCSNTWIGIKKEEAVFKNGIKWIVRKDSQLSFWFDKWLIDGPLRNIIHGPLNRGEDCLLLKDACSQQSWHREVISFQLPPNLLLRIKAFPFPIHASGTNRISWASSPNGELELKDAYRLAGLNTDDPTMNSFVENWVWKTNTIPKIKCFLWQCVHRSIPVRKVLVARGLNLPASCPLCNGPSESIIHVLRDCSIAQQYGTPYLHQCFPTRSLESIYQIGFISIVNHNNLVLWVFHGGFFFPLEYGTYGYTGIEWFFKMKPLTRSPNLILLLRQLSMPFLVLMRVRKGSWEQFLSSGSHPTKLA